MQSSPSAVDPEDVGHHDREITIIVNGRPRAVTSKELTYDEVLALAYGTNVPSGPNVVITVTYRRGAGNKSEGGLVQGETVKVKEGMVFNVVATDKS